MATTHQVGKSGQQMVTCSHPELRPLLVGQKTKPPQGQTAVSTPPPSLPSQSKNLQIPHLSALIRPPPCDDLRPVHRQQGRGTNRS
ncbi:hypothetical protein IMZ48_07680 [Candidatus Bathyarchaeota archaeon]|nr:hypothetical protein [Candidatus Bathyarchaeota archaeon]